MSIWLKTILNYVYYNLKSHPAPAKQLLNFLKKKFKHSYENFAAVLNLVLFLL